MPTRRSPWSSPSSRRAAPSAARAAPLGPRVGLVWTTTTTTTATAAPGGASPPGPRGTSRSSSPQSSPTTTPRASSGTRAAASDAPSSRTTTVRRLLWWQPGSAVRLGLRRPELEWSQRTLRAARCVSPAGAENCFSAFLAAARYDLRHPCLDLLVEHWHYLRGVNKTHRDARVDAHVRCKPG